jgi:glycine cleavage system T protein (aminomethyltransferase)
MVQTTPFHPRLAELNKTGLWKHWAGYLTAARYDMSVKSEHLGIRNSVAVFDSSPMYKYWIRGRDAERFLSGVMARDVRACKVGRAQYTLWCDDDGHILEDGVLFRHAGDEFMLTAAEPNLSYFEELIGRLEVEITDASADYGLLAVQGPRSREVLAGLAPEVADLPYFGFVHTKLAGAAVTVSRTGFTGDLGFEILVPAADALPVFDAVLEAGEPHGIRMMGDDALNLARIEAGLPLMPVEFESARLAFTDNDRLSPYELGLGWMLKSIDDPARPFIGRRALRAARDGATARWTTVGLRLDAAAYEAVHVAVGLMPEMDEVPAPWELMVYDADDNKIGIATSYTYSPMMQQYVAIARVLPDFGEVGSTVHVEITVDHEYVTVPAEVVRLPFFNPPRKTA